MTKKFKLLLTDCHKHKSNIYSQQDTDLEAPSFVVNKLYYDNKPDLSPESMRILGYKPKQLVVVSDDGIAIEDWFAWKGFPTSFKWVVSKYNACQPFSIESGDNYKKIVSSSNNQLNLSLIPLVFIEHYIKEYNNGNVIEEVEIELEKVWSTHIDEDIADSTFEYKLKINQQNEIAIIYK